MKKLTLVAVVILCTMFYAASPRVFRASAPLPSRATAGTSSQTASAISLRQDMRKLWTDHVVWTRDYIIAAVGDQPDATAAANRLMKNQEDIGTAIAKFYGACGSAAYDIVEGTHHHRRRPHQGRKGG